MKVCLSVITIFIVATALLAGCTGGPVQVPTTVTTAVPSASQPPETITPAAAPSLTGTSWKLGWYDDTKGVWSSVIQGSAVTATFTDTGTITGSNGCSGYTTEYVLLKDSGIWIRRPAVPETTCQAPTGVNNQQSVFYTDLLTSEKYAIVDNQLLMYDKTGKKILQFDAMP